MATETIRRRRHRPAARRPSAAAVLLASEGRPIPEAAVRAAAELAPPGTHVYVLSVARIWGSALGLAMPGLLPSTQEWADQRAIVRAAVEELERLGVEARGEVVATRRAAKTIADAAKRFGSSAIVIGADPPRNRLVADLLWSQEPYRVRRRASVPVYLVTEP